MKARLSSAGSDGQARRAADRLLLRGCRHHTGYFVNRPDCHAAAMRDLAGAVARLRERTGFEPGVLDLGGGWACPADPESGEPTVLLARVQWVKEQFGRRFIVTDAQKHVLLRACVEGCRCRWVKADDLDAPAVGPAELFGPTCPDDGLALGCPFPAVARGDVVAALACGACAQTFGASLNPLPRPATVLVNGDRAAVVVRRETVDDVPARYGLPDWLR